ncbi:MAG: peptidoglycan DD-metalloendopeptidase family protein, partial [Oscillospiraceae bacterium]
MIESNIKKNLHKFFVVFMSIVIMVTSCVFITSSTPIKAKSVQDLEQNIKDLENENKKINNNIKNVEGKIESLEEERALINTQIENTQKQITLYQQKMEIMTKNIKEKEKAIATKSAEIEKDENLFAERVKAIYIKNSTSAVTTILSAKSFGDFLSQTEIMKKISQSDAELIKKLNGQKKELSAAKTEMVKQNASLTKTKSDFDKKSSDLTSLKNKNNTSQARYEQIQQNYINSKKKNEKEIQRVDAQITKMLQDLASAGSNGPEGPFKWPVPSSSRISSPYGYRVILGNSEFHRGIDIPAGTGTPIVAANSGTVVAVTSSPGRGQYLIINHGGGLATLYQHCSAIYVSSGQTVQKGQKIAAVGN